MRIKRAIAIIALARSLDKSEREGNTTISVPAWLAPEVNAMIYERKVKRARKKWKRNITEVSVSEWEDAIRKASSRLGRDVMDKDRKEDGKS